MTESILQADTPPDALPGVGIPMDLSDILVNLVVAFLAPMFLGASGGDIGFARRAAVETVNAYRARDHADLIAIAQIIACGLAALGSLSLSLADNLSLSMTLRLRGQAVALNRVAEQHRRARSQSRPDSDAPYYARTAGDCTGESDDAQYEAQVVAGVAAARQLAAQAQASLWNAQPSASLAPIPAAGAIVTPPVATAAGPAAPVNQPVPTPAAPPVAGAPDLPTPVTAMTDQQRQAMWASAMTDVAAEFTADLANLPPAERRMASRRAAVLSLCANQLIAGDVPSPPGPVRAPATMRPDTAA
jgi:hypothetical protein